MPNVRRMPHPGPRVAVSTFFLFTGLIAGTWFGRIPAVTSNLDLDKGQIGSLLLFVAVGSLVAFQVIGTMIVRFGSTRCTQYAGYLMSAGLLLAALAPNPASLGVALFVFGFAVGSMSIAMNAQGVIVQQRLGRPIMSSLHGFFTLGTLIGSAIGGLMAELGIGAVPHFLVFSTIGLAVVTVAAPGLIAEDTSEESSESQSGLVIPPRALWPLGVVAFCAGIGEGSMYDWSALYVHDDLGASESVGALAFAAFSTAMLIGRFAGDRVVERLGSANVIRAGSLIAALGLLAGLVAGTVAAAFVGFALLGLGLSVLMPLVYSAAGSHPGISNVRGVAAIATMGFTGLLAGPPILGTLADASSLRAALGVVVILCTIMAVLASKVKTTAIQDEASNYPEIAGEHVS